MKMKKLLLLLAFLIPLSFGSCEKEKFNDSTQINEHSVKSQSDGQVTNADYLFMAEEAQCMLDYLMNINDDIDDDIALKEIGIDSSATLKLRLPKIIPSIWGFYTFYPVDISILDGNPLLQSVSIILKCDGDVTFGGVMVEYLNPTQINYTGVCI